MAYQNNPYANNTTYGQGNPYGDPNPSPYGQAGNPYAQTSPYEQAGNPYSQRQGQGQYNNQPAQYEQTPGVAMYQDNAGSGVGGGAYEMGNMNNSDPNRILNSCRQADRDIDDLEVKQQNLRNLHRQYLSDTDASQDSPLSRRIAAESDDLLRSYRALVNRVKAIKSDKESGNPRNSAQVGKVDRRLKSSMNQYQQLDRDYNRDLKAQMERQYRIVRPDASEAEIREAVEDPSNTQVFSQALIQSDRRGQAQTVASEVRNRHRAIQKIEQDMVQLAQMFNDLEALVVQQEAPVQQIEQRAEEVTQNTKAANVELDGAVKKARAARRKKWICFGIGVLIIIVIIVVVVAVYFSLHR